jgi:hypothetical protein
MKKENQQKLNQIELKYVQEQGFFKSKIKFVQLKEIPQWHTYKKYKHLGE